MDGGRENGVDKIDRRRAQWSCLSARYTVTVMMFLGFIISFGMRCNLGVAMLEVRDKFAKKAVLIDSSFSWGYLATQIPSGFLTSYIPANQIFGVAVIGSSICNLFIPVAVEMSLDVLILLRGVQGLFEGAMMTACLGIWRFWAPPLERSRHVTIGLSGTYAGIIIGLPLSGYLANSNRSAPFYFYGILGMLWWAAWLWLASENPRKHRTINEFELSYIETSLGESLDVAMPTISATPWRDIVRSKPVIAIVVADFCRSWCFYTLLYQSAYLKAVFYFKTAEAGLLGALPHMLLLIVVPLGGIIADHLRKCGTTTTTNVRKLFNCGGFGLQSLFLLLLFFSNTATKALTFLTLAVACAGFAISGYRVNYLDIAPRYASIITGISNFIATLSGVICPIAVGYISADQSPISWSIVFITAACVNVFGVIFYGICASGELQYWAEPALDGKQAETKAEIAKETDFYGPQQEEPKAEDISVLTYSSLLACLDEQRKNGI